MHRCIHPAGSAGEVFPIGFTQLVDPIAFGDEITGNQQVNLILLDAIDFHSDLCFFDILVRERPFLAGDVVDDVEACETQCQCFRQFRGLADFQFWG